MKFLEFLLFLVKIVSESDLISRFLPSFQVRVNKAKNSLLQLPMFLSLRSQSLISSRTNKSTVYKLISEDNLEEFIKTNYTMLLLDNAYKFDQLVDLALQKKALRILIYLEGLYHSTFVWQDLSKHKPNQSYDSTRGNRNSILRARVLSFINSSLDEANERTISKMAEFYSEQSGEKNYLTLPLLKNSNFVLENVPSVEEHEFQLKLLRRFIPYLSESVSIKNPHKIKLPFNEYSSFMFELFTRTKNIKDFLMVLTRVVENHPFKAQEITEELFSRLQKKYPSSYLINDVIKTKALPLWNADLMTLERFLAPSLEEAYPRFTNRALKRSLMPKLLKTKELRFNRGNFPPFDRTYFLGYILDEIHESLKYPLVEAQWFLDLRVNSIGSYRSRAYMTSGAFLNLLESMDTWGSKKLWKSVCQSYAIYQDDDFTARDTIDMIKGYGVNLANLEYKGESLRTLHDFLFMKFKDDSFTELHAKEIEHFHGVTVEHNGGIYAVVVPKIAKELKNVGQYLSICVGNGIYKDKILKKTSFVFFLQLEGKISHCVEVEPYEDSFCFIQTKGLRNKDMESGLRLSLRVALNLKTPSLKGFGTVVVRR